ncbi:MAG TPA: phosphoribosylaminoimidazolesuccinocarboxamide synthase [Spirochaetota bacterium]|nr:phosphoribosylaminoimidazolesuccinocarboxamide synthase [Spirochaetota bacterium]HOM38450.1 phosphoribosylaminoimidazolesuccinocarboxamide synthase [Spirochaetota bacterium]HPQ48990.1 phosphoribosylaminoimidazolesuccinocarboxamide synthase [Spirochaetota bacterium]
MEAIMNIELPLKLLHKGKVRNMYEIDSETLLLVATDRVSAFDRVFPNGIPGKGKILTQISNKWFKIINYPNHIIETDIENFPEPLNKYFELEDRTVIVKKAKRIDIECVVRGFIIGSGWKEYKESGSVCGIKLPKGLKMASKLSEPIFTPAFKNDKGHDENITFERMVDITGYEIANKLKDISIDIYTKAYNILYDKGIILADTKFEFGIYNGEIILIDEILTPDSSRFWVKEFYKEGESPVSYDKQFIRDYCISIGWEGDTDAPSLPDEIVKKTLEKYNEIYSIISSI